MSFTANFSRKNSTGLVPLQCRLDRVIHNTGSIEGFSPDENMRKTLEVSPIFTVFSSEENIVRKYNFSKVFNADLSMFSLGKTLKKSGKNVGEN